MARNKKQPKHILYYRDGVSESQYAKVREYELQQIRKGYMSACNASTAPAVTFIIVGNRHNTRFYPESKKDVFIKVQKGYDGKPDIELPEKNVQPGLVVDSAITQPKNNFYLQSHAALAGTARSAHYYILENGMGGNDNTLREVVNLSILNDLDIRC